MLDWIIRNGLLLDGTGAAGRVGDVGIRGDRIVAVGAVDEPAERTVDATGLAVAPGFVDIHTHYDAQAFWDPMLTPSPLHGVTTVFGGNCGFSIAPLSEEAGAYLKGMLARVEGMPLESLEAGVPWDWRSFGEYLSRLDGRLAINAGFLVGHSALRRVVMGPAAVGEEASPEQIEAMVRLLHDSLAEGGMGFSSSNAPTHNDDAGHPVPSRSASREEILALAAAVADHPGTTLEFIPTVGRFEAEHLALMTEMSVAANRPLNWNVLGVAAYNEEMQQNQLGASDHAAARGGRVVALTPSQVMTLRINLKSGFIFDALPGWADVLGLPLPERKQALADPGVRARLDADAHSEAAGALRAIAVWKNMRVDAVRRPENAGFEGRTLGEIGEELSKSPFDALLDLALSEDLDTSFSPFIPGDDDASWELRGRVWRDDRTVIGASDAGAHLDMIDTFTYSTSLLGPAVRDKGLLPLEEAVRQLTDVPARLYGVRERGRLAPGWFADVVVFDPARVGPGPVHFRADLPAGASRLYAEARGIEHVLVNGTEIAAKGELTGAAAGLALRSGRDTETVAVHD
jgi:N-acyl-D-aspartate/D-glutamate deacylase